MSGDWMNPLRRVARRGYLATTIALEERGHHGAADRLDRLAGRGDVVTVCLPDGRRVKMRRRDDRDQVAAQVAREGYNSFETPLPAVLVQLAASTGGTIFDVGANTGYYSLLAATVSAGPVIAFEPNPTVRPLLAANLDLNGAGRRVTVEARAVGCENGVLPLYLPPPTARLVETSASLNRDFKDEVDEVVPARGKHRDGGSCRRPVGIGGSRRTLPVAVGPGQRRLTRALTGRWHRGCTASS